MTPKRRLKDNISASANKLRLDSINKRLRFDSSKKNKKDALVKNVSRIALSELLKNSSCSTFENNGHELPDFKTFLSSQDNIDTFREFLKTQYCQENLNFYLACEKYRKTPHADGIGKDLIKFMAKQIFNDFLSENAKQAVNVDYECIQTISKGIHNPGPNLFRDAQNEVFNLMSIDCYPRFCKTWPLDPKAARKILCLRSMKPETQSNNDITMSSVSTIYHSKESSSHNKTISSVSSFQPTVQNVSWPKQSSYCPSNCPYFRVGLPCQQHMKQDTKTSDQSDLIDHIDLKKLHQVPNLCARRSPPPPPLPPKSERIKSLSQGGGKFYVSKVYHV